ncbi:MAG: acyloxyacyl hydrolase [Phycisphaerales bacterium]|nr:acyloxyacyl hydrolase [Phycisphaerales bacterium]
MSGVHANTANELNVETSLTLEPVKGEGAAAATVVTPTTSSAGAGEVPKAKGLYLEPGPMYLTLGGGVAHNFNSATDFNGFAQISTFVAPKFELGFELGGWYFDQPGKNAEGVSGSLAMKYHFWHSEKRDVTAFGELGIGVLVASRQVPAGGTNVDFMPRAGAGLTWEVAEGVRLVGGVRWHHISNARIKGDSRNPSRDGLMGYVGVSFALP